MKKLTSLLLLFLCAMGMTVSAQITSVGDPIADQSAIESGKTYVLYNTGRGWYPSYGASAVTVFETTDLTTSGIDGLSAVIQFEKVDGTESDYKVKALRANTYWGTDVKATTTDAAQAGVYTITQNGNATAFNLKIGGTWVDGDSKANGGLVTWHEQGTAATGNGVYHIIPVEAENITAESTSVTYNYQVDGKTFATTTSDQLVGATLAAPAAQAFTEIVSYTGEGEDVTANQVVTVTCTANLPFNVSTTDQTYWYAIDMHSNDAGTDGMGRGETGTRSWFWTAAADGNVTVSDLPYAQNVVLGDEYLWKITGNMVDGFQFINKLLGDTYKLTKPDTGDAAISSMTTDGANVNFKIAGSSQITGAAAFHLEGDASYLNKQAGVLKGWTSNDGGSSCLFRPVTYFPIRYAEKILPAVPEGALGAPIIADEAIKAALDAAKEAAAAAPFDADKAEALVAASTAAEAAITTPELPADLSGYYRIVNKAYPTRNLLLDNDGVLKANEVDAQANVATVFSLTRTEDGNYLVSVEGKYLGSTTKSAQTAIVAESEGIPYTLTADGATFSIKNSQAGDHSYLHDGGVNVEHKIVGWNINAAATWWYLVPATAVDVPLNTVAGASYATTYLPFDISGIAGATAYTGAYDAAAGTLSMTALTDGIPANTAVVLQGEANVEKATLTLGTASAIGSTNDLSGTLTPVTLTDDNRTGYLVLGLDTEDNSSLGFFTPSSTVTAIPGNKAFLTTETTASQAIRLNFGGTSTGIDGIINATTTVNTPIYDLTGRRVTKTVKGGLYIQSGKKFIGQ